MRRFFYICLRRRIAARLSNVFILEVSAELAMSEEPWLKPRNTPDRSVRSLQNLQANASSARAFNLLSIWLRAGKTDEYRDSRFFQSPVLNRSIIVKHRLRRDERDVFKNARSEATKVILPLNIEDLRLGARSFFVGQVGYEDVLEEILGQKGSNHTRDASLLRLIDSLPSLDPFLMRERLKQHGFQPARCYFAISPADTSRMLQFARQEVGAMVGMSIDDVTSINDKADNLAAKILGDSGAEDLEPLRLGMGLDHSAFAEGIFCWKGFIYYKWILTELAPKIPQVAAELAHIRPAGPVSSDGRALIVVTRERLSKALASACETVRGTLKVYDAAYTGLTRNADPQGFRDFLVQAPNLFYELGERLGSVQHVISFWRYRFPENAPLKIGGDELIELLVDFKSSLNFNRLDAAA